MPSMTATVRYVNQPKPGKQNGSIKLTDDTFLGVRPNMLSVFSPGTTYDIEFEEREWQGQMYKTVKTAKPASQTNGATTAPQAGGAPVRASWSPKDSEHAFVTKVLGDAVRSGKLDLTAETLTKAVRMLRVVHKEGFAGSVGQAWDEEIGDQIGF